MLIGIPRILSPNLMAVMMEMGHGDELVIADMNFPACSIARAAGGQVIRADGACAAEMLDAILTLMPLDYAVQSPVAGMIKPDGPAPIHDEFRKVLAQRGYGPEKMEFMSKADFYARAGRTYAVVATGESARFANLIIKKGVIG